MGFNNFNVITRAQRLCGKFKQFERHVHTHTHIGRHYDGNVIGSFGNLKLLRVRKAGSANHHFHAQLAADGQVRHGAFRTGKVNQNAGVF